jgi:outer membrane protein assembly factor BamB
VTRVAAALFALALLGAPADAAPGDWPQWLGPDRNGVSLERGLAKTWPKAGPPVRWARDLGDGLSGMSIVGDRLYTMYSVKRTEFVACLDANTGKEIWRRFVGDTLEDHMGSDGPRSTPTVVDGAVYALASRGVMVALDATTGAVRWRHDLVREYGAVLPKWGFCQSLLVHGGKVYLDPGGTKTHSLMAFDAKTGAVAWHGGQYKAGYSSPVVGRLAGVEQVLFFTGKALVSTTPHTGRVLWELAWETSYDVSAATPLIFDQDRFFVSTGYGTGAALYRLEKRGAAFVPSRLWRKRTMKNKMATSVRLGAHIYGFDEDRLAAVALETGERIWSQPGFDRGSLIAADGKLFVLGEGCNLALVEATPGGYVERGRMKVLGELCWTVPALSRGRLFVRDIDRIVSLDVTAPPKP